MSDMTTLGQLIERRMTARGVQAKDLATEVHRTSSWVSDLLGGRKVNLPEPDTMRRIGAMVGLSMKEMMEAAGYLSAEDAGHDKAGLEEIHARLDQSLSVLSERDLQVVIELAEFLARTSDPASPQESGQQHDDPAPTIGALSGDDESQ